MVLEETEILAANNIELDRVFKVDYKLPKNPQNYTWQCLKCKKPLFYNQHLNCFKLSFTNTGYSLIF